MESSDPTRKVVRFPLRLGVIGDRLRGILTGQESTAHHDEDPDWQALLDEQLFRKRFGFDACRAFRERVIVLKQEADLTDREIRTLQRSGNLRFRDGQLEITTSRIEQVWGWIMIAVLGALMLMAVLAAALAEKPTGVQIAKVVGLEAFFVVLWWWTMEIYIHPTQIGKRALHMLSKTASS